MYAKVCVCTPDKSGMHMLHSSLVCGQFGTRFGKVIGLPHVSGINSLLVLSMPLSHKKPLYPLTIYADSTKRWWCIKQIYTTLSTKFNPNFHLESKVPFKVSQITDAHNLEAHFHL